MSHRWYPRGTPFEGSSCADFFQEFKCEIIVARSCSSAVLGSPHRTCRIRPPCEMLSEDCRGRTIYCRTRLKLSDRTHGSERVKEEIRLGWRPSSAPATIEYKSKKITFTHRSSRVKYILYHKRGLSRLKSMNSSK